MHHRHCRRCEVLLKQSPYAKCEAQDNGIVKFFLLPAKFFLIDAAGSTRNTKESEGVPKRKAQKEV